MNAVSAVDAISPAIQRTRRFLFRPFRWSTYLKLCLVAMITEGSEGNFSFSWPGTSGHRHAFSSPSHLTPGWIAVIAAASLLAIFLGFLIYYLITRLRFAYFHCLIHNTRQIRPGWRLYRTQAIRFFWLNVVVGLCFLLLMALIALPFVIGVLRLLHTTPVGGHPDAGLLLLLILPLIPIFFLVLLAGVATDLILRDWMLPHYALENATARQAWAAVRTRIKAEKAPFFVYALLRVFLPIVAAIAVLVGVVIFALVLAAIAVLLWLGFHSAMTRATGGAAIAGHLAIALAVAALFLAVLLLVVGLLGPLGTAIREYALVFYGGRYQRLGEILFPPPIVGLNLQGTT